MDEEGIAGSWMSRGWKVRLEARREGEAWSLYLVEGLENGERDEANPDPALRGRPLLGAALAGGLTFDGRGWSGGWVYDPETGHRYSCLARLAGSGADRELILRGYLGLPVLGIAQRMQRPGARADLTPGCASAGALSDLPPPWEKQRARAWMDARPWPLGCDYTPAYAANQLEFWRSFNPEAIDGELALAEGLGFNTLRVYLHYLAWLPRPRVFLDRLGRFFDLAARRGMAVMPVLFDDCWNDPGLMARIAAPRPGAHNSRWLRCPGTRMVRDPSSWHALEDYAGGIMDAFRSDERVLCWDLYNEPGNGAGFLPTTVRLLGEVFKWARRVDPDQPLTCGIWKRSSWFKGLNRFILDNSDLVSFHNYGPASSMAAEIDELSAEGRPMICTEYMARGMGSRFQTHLPLLRSHGVGAINWGLVDGRTQTKYPWNSRPGSPEPEPWFHDIFRSDGSPYDVSEIECIRKEARQAGLLA